MNSIFELSEPNDYEKDCRKIVEVLKEIESFTLSDCCFPEEFDQIQQQENIELFGYVTKNFNACKIINNLAEKGLFVFQIMSDPDEDEFLPEGNNRSYYLSYNRKKVNDWIRLNIPKKNKGIEQIELSGQFLCFGSIRIRFNESSNPLFLLQKLFKRKGKGIEYQEYFKIKENIDTLEMNSKQREKKRTNFYMICKRINERVTDRTKKHDFLDFTEYQAKISDKFIKNLIFPEVTKR